MLFRYTENPPENAIFPSVALRFSVVAFSYTENSSFPYTPNVVASLRQPRFAQGIKIPLQHRLIFKRHPLSLNFQRGAGTDSQHFC